jgi:hypothetical protein
MHTGMYVLILSPVSDCALVFFPLADFLWLFSGVNNNWLKYMADIEYNIYFYVYIIWMLYIALK